MYVESRKKGSRTAPVCVGQDRRPSEPVQCEWRFLAIESSKIMLLILI